MTCGDVSYPYLTLHLHLKYVHLNCVLNTQLHLQRYVVCLRRWERMLICQLMHGIRTSHCASLRLQRKCNSSWSDTLKQTEMIGRLFSWLMSLVVDLKVSCTQHFVWQHDSYGRWTFFTQFIPHILLLHFLTSSPVITNETHRYMVTCVCRELLILQWFYVRTSCRVLCYRTLTIITASCTTENLFGASYAKQHWTVSLS